MATVDGVLDTFDLRWHDEPALTVVMATNGYPGEYRNGTEIRGLDAARAVPGVEVFHAGTQLANGKVVTNGGRVLCAVGMGAKVLDSVATPAVNSLMAEPPGRDSWPAGRCGQAGDRRQPA